MADFFNDKVMAAFSSMKTTDSISLDDVEKLSMLEHYYVDPFNYVNNIMQDEDNFIIGRRGTGKSTLIYRSYVECLKTWDESKKVYKPRILPLFLDMSQCTSISNDQDSGISFEDYFTAELIRSFRKYIYKFWENIVPCDGNHNESNMLEEIDLQLNDIEQLIKTGKPILISSPEIENKRKNNNDTKETFKVSNKGIDIDYSENDGEVLETTQKIITKSNYTLGEFLDRLNQIKESAQISAIYVFIDEYSELSTENQIKLSTLLKRLTGSRSGIYFKIAVITDNYNLGPIRLQRDFYEISIDFHKFVERSTSLNKAFENLENYTANIISNRLEAYDCKISLDKLFSNKDSIVLLSRASIAVPRTVGIILKEAWNQSISSGRKYINIDDLNFGINSAGDAYFAFFKGNVGIAIPKFYDDLWNDLISRARDERKVNNKKAACYFLISAFRDNHFKFLSENYLIHLIKKGTETTVKGETGKSLYLIDYSFIQKYNLGFELDRDTIRQQRFLYDNLLKTYDHFFSETRTAFTCPFCKTEYTEQQLFIPGLNTTLSFCPKDQTKLIKFEGQDYKEYNFTEEERKIMGTIRNRSRDNSILAREVAEIVGSNKYKVAMFVDRIMSYNIIGREKIHGPSKPYSYYKIEESI